MRLIHYVLPSPLVVRIGWNLDTFVYILLLTLLNPIIVWVFYFTDKVSKRFAFTIVFLWICRYSNLCMRQSNGSVTSKKVVLITGGISGLGLEAVREWNSQKDIKEIIVIDVKVPINEHDHTLKKVRFLQYDLVDTNLDFLGPSEKNIDFVDLSKVDVLVCNAGIRQIKNIAALNTQDILNIVNVNWISHLLLIKRYIEAVKAQGEEKRFHIVVVGSVLGFVGPKKLGIYAATKNALMATMDSLREELPLNIALTTILPGQLDSAMFADVSVNQFLAPVIDSRMLAKRISAIVREGLNGTFAYPIYGRFLPVYRVLPWWAQRFCRWFSGMDNV